MDSLSWLKEVREPSYKTVLICWRPERDLLNKPVFKKKSAAGTTAQCWSSCKFSSRPPALINPAKSVLFLIKLFLNEEGFIAESGTINISQMNGFKSKLPVKSWCVSLCKLFYLPQGKVHPLNGSQQSNSFHFIFLHNLGLIRSMVSPFEQPERKDVQWQQPVFLFAVCSSLWCPQQQLFLL